MLQVRRVQIAAADAPEVELVGLAHMQPVDGVATVDQADRRQQDVGRLAVRRQVIQQRWDHRRGVRAQHGRSGHVARVARVARDGVGRVPQALVIVVDGYHGIGAVHEHLTAPGGA